MLKQKKIYSWEDERESIISDTTETSKPPSAVASNNQSAFTSKLFTFRIIVFLSLCLTAVSFGIASYYILDYYESEQFEVVFHSHFTQIGDRWEAGINRAVRSSAQTSVYLGSIHEKEKWPYVMTSHFETVFSQLRKISQLQTLAFAPIFNETLKENFTDYFNDAYANMTGISADYEISSGFENNSASIHTFFAPIINQEPDPYALMLDAYNDAQFGTAIVDIMECVRLDFFASFHRSERCVSFSDLVANTHNLPRLTILSPIYPFNDPNNVVGVTIFAFDLQESLQAAVPHFVSGTDIVVISSSLDGQHDTCSTYSIVDGHVFIKCPDSDCHDSSVPYHGHAREIEIAHATVASRRLSFAAHPTRHLYDLHNTDMPLLLCMCSVFLVLLASILVFVYDHFVKVESITNLHIMESRRRLVRFVSHEIRTPLNTVTLGLDLLYQLISSTDLKCVCERDSNDDERQADLDLITDVERSTAAAVMVLNDLLDYDDIEMDLMEISLQPVNALEYMISAIQQFNIQAKQGRIKFVCNLNQSMDGPCEASYLTSDLESTMKSIQTEEGLLPLSSFLFMADKHRLIQVFRNLISNALKFTPAGGTVQISAFWKPTLRSEAKINKQCASVKFSVRDTGPGISKRNQKLLFGEGVQFDANRLQQGRGSGLGLYISKKIIEAHGGSIWATSEGEGEGSCFFIEMPLVKSEEGSGSVRTNEHTSLSKHPLRYRSRSQEKSPALINQNSISNLNNSPIGSNIHIMIRTKRILVVDDALSNRKMVCRMLQINGFHADQAVDGMDCLRIVKKGPDTMYYDCILMDYVMPNMDGPEVTKALRELGYTNPIIGLTGNLMCDDINHFLASGADVVMPKPFQFKDFREMVVNPVTDI